MAKSTEVEVKIGGRTLKLTNLEKVLYPEVGFTKAGDAWRWRGRRGPAPDRRGPPSHAFAELAKLKR